MYNLVLHPKGPNYSLGIALPQIWKSTEEGYCDHLSAEVNNFDIFRKKSDYLLFTQINQKQNHGKYQKS